LIFQIQVKSANSNFNESGKELLKKLQELSEHRLRNRNIAATIEMLSMCIPGKYGY